MVDRPDSDGDGIADVDDLCPAVPDPEQVDSDGDGVGDACPCDSAGGDTDGDRVCDENDNCPFAFNLAQLDRDDDGLGDVCDPTPAPPSSACEGRGGDLDGDGWCGVDDNCPNDPNEDQADVDGDGVGDACAVDVCDAIDNDADGTTDEDAPDTDGDGVVDCVDECPGESDVDSDEDGAVDCVDPCPADPTDTDSDDDGICDAFDNCPMHANPYQSDRDGDGIGNNCDVEECNGVSDDLDGYVDEGTPDEDGDGICDALDPCLGDPLDDPDGDGLCARDDNCPMVANAAQSDADGDGSGDACDLDFACGPSAPLLADGALPWPATVVPADIAGDRTRALVYVAVARASSSLPNQLVALDPSTGSIRWQLQLAAEPALVALADDDSRIYIAFRDASWIQSIDLSSRSLCGSFRGPTSLRVTILEPVPEHPERTVIGFGSELFLFHEGQARPETAFATLACCVTQIVRATSPTRLFGNSRELDEFSLDERGIHSVRGDDIRLDADAGFVHSANRLYGFGGQIVDLGPPVTSVGRLPVRGPVVPVPSLSRAFSAAPGAMVVTDLSTLLEVRRTPYPAGFESVTKVARWGDDGLALLGEEAGEARLLILDAVVRP